MAANDTASVELRPLRTSTFQDDHQDEMPTDKTTRPDMALAPLGLATKRRTVLQATARCLSRWLVTLAVVASLVGVLYHYSEVPVMDKAAKKVFNTVVTGLSIALGLAITSSLDDIIRDLRWCLLAQRYRSRHKVERILQADKLTHLLGLAFTSHRLTIHVAVAAWVLLLLGSQIAVASLGLCYSVDTATGQALTVPGDILIADMSTVQTTKLLPSKSAELNAQQFTAHSYGLISSAYTLSSIDAIKAPGSIYAPGDAILFIGDSSSRYVFRETSAASVAADGTNALAIITSRSIDASTACRSARVTQGGDGRGSQLTIISTDPSDPSVINLGQASNGGTDQTSYMINTTQTCGPGCVPITAFEASATDPWFYTCNTTVSTIANTTRREHEISDTVRVLAAGAIALQGVSTSSLANDSAVSQYQSFPAESFFGMPTNGSAASMSLLLSQFAIGTVAAIAEYNDPQVISGSTAPARGENLTVKHWDIIMAILIGAVAAQLVFEVGVAVWAFRVAVPPDDMVAQAQVLRQLTMAAGSVRGRRSGRAVKGEKSDDEDGDGASGALWMYRATPLGSSGLFDLHFDKRSV
ncbi:uncharacterized protein B0I36DRAFT_316463 [Microdochium trichocladiopsis]|uniref:Uncharacterized protein n=1 Tax=Microdochium trichocladiopsis TaxID=1682393 RepID=A0A9P8YAK1_9PEZI|nr:uncharacterized protein B0I36DRAFT_316463 [Microdochium trichocladiopsis]KAH7034509.1 hypothetical protein B0I36DRAFT_316463 [Microdochium trichocladiopsis]